MALQEGALSILLALVVTSVVVVLLFWIGGKIGAKGTKTPGKLAPYTGGENLLDVELQVDVERFFMYALFFLIFDAFAFLLTLSFAQPGIYPVIFIAITLLAVIIMIPLRGPRRGPMVGERRQ